MLIFYFIFFFFFQAEDGIRDYKVTWSSDVCSSDLGEALGEAARRNQQALGRHHHVLEDDLGLRDAAQPHRRLTLADAKPLRLAAHGDEAADALLLAVLVEDAREDEVEA